MDAQQGQGTAEASMVQSSDQAQKTLSDAMGRSSSAGTGSNGSLQGLTQNRGGSSGKALTAITASLGSALNTYQQNAYDQKVKNRMLDMEQEKLNLSKIKILGEQKQSARAERQATNAESSKSYTNLLEKGHGKGSFIANFANGSPWAVKLAEQTASDNLTRESGSDVSVKYEQAKSSNPNMPAIDSNGDQLFNRVVYDTKTGERIRVDKGITSSTIESNVESKLTDLGYSHPDIKDFFKIAAPDYDNTDPSNLPGQLIRMAKNKVGVGRMSDRAETVKIENSRNKSSGTRKSPYWNNDSSLHGSSESVNGKTTPNTTRTLADASPTETNNYTTAASQIGAGTINKENGELTYTNNRAKEVKTKDYRMLTPSESRNVVLTYGDGKTIDSKFMTKDLFIKQALKENDGFFFPSSTVEKEETIRKATNEWNNLMHNIRSTDPDIKVIPNLSKGTLEFAHIGDSGETYKGDKALELSQAGHLFSSPLFDKRTRRERKRAEEGFPVEKSIFKSSLFETTPGGTGRRFERIKAAKIMAEKKEFRENKNSEDKK